MYRYKFKYNGETVYVWADNLKEARQLADMPKEAPFVIVGQR